MDAVKVKICGLTSPGEAADLNKSGADFAGFVFYPPSKRNITFGQAAEIMPLLDPKIRRVAVTVSPDRKLAEKIMENSFDLIQIHKMLDREVLEILSIPVWYAFNVSKPEELEKQEAFLHELPENLNSKITGIVVDGADFGSGKTFDWGKKEFRWRKSIIFKDRKLILAGGLTPENVAEGIRIFHPDIVDVSSGVEKESSSGRRGKDPEKVAAFCRSVKSLENGEIGKEQNGIRRGQKEIGKEQAEVRKEQAEVRKEQKEIGKEQAEVRKEQAEVRKEQDKKGKEHE